MKNHRKNIFAATITTGLVLFGATSQSWAENVSMLWSNYLPAHHPILTKVFKPYMAKVAEVTEGRVKITLPPAPLGPPNRQFDLVKDGVAGITFSLNGFTPGRFPLSRLAELPFGGEKGEAVSVAYWRTYQKYLKKANMYPGMKLLALSTTSAGTIWASKKHVTSMADFKGQKFMEAGGISADVVKALGATQVVTPPPKWFETISRGIADGTILPTGVPANFKFQKFVKYQTTVKGGLVNNSFYVVMNKKIWDKISEKDRMAISKISGEALSRKMGKIWDVIDDFGRKKFAKFGVKSIRASDAFVADIRTALKGFDGAWYALAKKHGVDGKAALAMLRAEASKIDGK